MNHYQLSLDAKIGEVNSFINLWKQNGGQVGQLSDGFHNFDQLYQHRIELRAAAFDDLPTCHLERFLGLVGAARQHGVERVAITRGAGDAELHRGSHDSSASPAWCRASRSVAARG